jgi:enolase
MIKTGVLGGERLAKLNELIRSGKDFPMADLSI